MDQLHDRLLAAVASERRRLTRRAMLDFDLTPVLHHIARWDRAIPQYHLGHLERVAAIQARAARHPGLVLTGNAYHGVAMNDCTEQSERIAGRWKAAFS